jgi:lipoate-protein ligase A
VISVQGVTDLTAGRFKISGNAQKRSRNAILFHGTFLLNFDLQLIEKYLSHPTKEPDYRGKRSHSQFIQNIPFQSNELKLVMRNHWGANKGGLVSIDPKAVSQLVETKYGNESWVKR